MDEIYCGHHGSLADCDLMSLDHYGLYLAIAIYYLLNAINETGQLAPRHEIEWRGYVSDCRVLGLHEGPQEIYVGPNHRSAGDFIERYPFHPGACGVFMANLPLVLKIRCRPRIRVSHLVQRLAIGSRDHVSGW
jgi:hypothetical protein